MTDDNILWDMCVLPSNKTISVIYYIYLYRFNTVLMNRKCIKGFTNTYVLLSQSYFNKNVYVTYYFSEDTDTVIRKTFY